MSIDNNTRPARPLNPERAADTGLTRRQRIHNDIALARLVRDIGRCPCGHGEGVHNETGCQMTGCGCDDYQG